MASLSNLFFGLILVLSFLVYQYTYVEPFLPLSCQLLGLNCPKASDTLSGFVEPEFSEIKNIFVKNIENGLEVGASVTIYYNNKIVADLTGGISDWETGKVYNNHTLQLVYSSTKVLTSLVVARLVEQGILDYDEKISTYWPEFSQGNKENVTLGHLMTHKAGVGWFENYLTKTVDLHNLDSLSKILETQPHNFGGIPTRSYHACTGGYYLNEIVRRVDPKRRTIGQIVHEEIMPTYNIEFYYSTPEDIYKSRVAQIYSYPMPRAFVKSIIKLIKLPELMITDPIHQMFPTILFDYIITKPISWLLGADLFTPAYKTLVNSCPDQALAHDLNKLEVAKAEGPSYNGITNTRSMGKLAAMMANKGKPLPESEGIEPELLNNDTMEKYLERDTAEFDVALFENITMAKGGIGYFTFAGVEGLENYEFLGWGGAGGSVLLWSEELKIGFAYCMNAFHTSITGDKRSIIMLKETVNTVLRLRNIS